jgi:hypothetical protein
MSPLIDYAELSMERLKFLQNSLEQSSDAMFQNILKGEESGFPPWKNKSHKIARMTSMASYQNTCL